MFIFFVGLLISWIIYHYAGSSVLYSFVGGIMALMWGSVVGFIFMIMGWRLFGLSHLLTQLLIMCVFFLIGSILNYRR
jgi:hypothetical protein